MSPTVGDLVRAADRRAATAALLGWLLLEEPGPALGDLVSGVPALAPLGSADHSLIVEYERVFLRRTAPYESAFVNIDGRRGGTAAANLAERYASVGFDEGDGSRWRVAGPDHLGLELRCYAVICEREAQGWRDEQPDRAVRAVEVQRSFLADHLAAWADLALDAVEAAAPAGPYAALAAAVRQFLVDEAEMLRPAPEHTGMAPEEHGPVAPLNASRLAQFLLTPALSGVWLDEGLMASVCATVGAPWRATDSRAAFGQVLESAAASGELGLVLGAIRPAVVGTANRWEEREQARPGAVRLLRSWRMRAERTVRVLDQCISTRSDRPEEVWRVELRGPDAGALSALAEELRARGFGVDRLPQS